MKKEEEERRSFCGNPGLRPMCQQAQLLFKGVLE